MTLLIGVLVSTSLVGFSGTAHPSKRDASGFVWIRLVGLSGGVLARFVPGTLVDWPKADVNRSLKEARPHYSLLKAWFL